jgi:CRISPR-associated protein Csb2
MLRHSASQPAFASAVGWDKSKVDAFVLGHDKSDPTNVKPTASMARLVFIPLPSLEWRGEDRGNTVGAIRRVLLMVSGHCDTSEFLRVVRAFEGQELTDEKSKQAVAFLRRQSEKDNAVSAYFQSATTWVTVTPVILPGYDDPRKLRHRLRAENNNLTAEEKTAILHKLDKRVEFLLRKAIRQAGFSESLAQHALLEWRGGGFLPGTELASRYSVPDQHRRYRRLHVRITWRSSEGLAIPIPGPICIGGGKYSGLGLFVPVTDSK